MVGLTPCGCYGEEHGMDGEFEDEGLQTVTFGMEWFGGGAHPRHMEVPRLRIESELWDPSCVCNLHHSSQQCQLLNPLREARDQTRILMDTSRIHFHCATTGTPWTFYYFSGKGCLWPEPLGALSSIWPGGISPAWLVLVIQFPPQGAKVAA